MKTEARIAPGLSRVPRSVPAVHVDDYFGVATAIGLARQDEASHARVAARRRRPCGQHQQRAGHQPFALQAALTLRSLRTDFAARTLRTGFSLWPLWTFRTNLAPGPFRTGITLWPLRTLW